MKMFKKFIAIILCITVISGLCATGAFAYEFGDVEFFRNSIFRSSEFFYAGKAVEGDNLIEYKDEYDSPFFFLEFEAKESGNYSFSGGFIQLYQFLDSEMKKIESESVSYSEDSFYIYLEKGTYYLVEDFLTNTPEPTDFRLSIEFLGEFTGVSYNKEAFIDAVADEDVNLSSGCLFNTDPKLNFTEGSLDYNFEGRLYVKSEKELCVGENTVTFEILDYEFTETLTVIDARGFVKSIEVENIERFLERKYYYDSSRTGYAPYPEEIKVTLADGTVKTVKAVYEEENDNTPVYRFEHSNGREYTVKVEIPRASFCVLFGKTPYVFEEANITYASLYENIGRLAKNIFMIIKDSDGFEQTKQRVSFELKEFKEYYTPVIYTFF